MRRVARLERSIDLLRPRPIYTASTCPFHCSARASLSTTSRSQAAKPFTEKIRSKIWGTDSPPGLADPYGDASVFDKSKEAPAGEVVEEPHTSGYTKEEYDAMMALYEPATTSEGLEQVGGKGGWMRENWDVHHEFKGFFMRRTMVNNPEFTKRKIRQAVMEAFVLQQAGQSLSNMSSMPPKLAGRIAIIESSEGAVLEFAHSSGPQRILDSIATGASMSTDSVTSPNEAPTRSEEAIDADKSPVDPLRDIEHKPQPTESEEDIAADRAPNDPLSSKSASWDPVWLKVSLQDPIVKFSVVKRTMQLTGRRIPDSAINSITSVQDLVEHFVTPPKPRKVSEALAQKQDLLKLPNVTVSSRRITPIDKETAIGRWKVVEQELIERGLPVTRKVHWGDSPAKFRRA